MVYNNFKILLSAAEAIGEVETAQLSKYRNGWVEIKGTTIGGDPFTLRLIVESEENDD